MPIKIKRKKVVKRIIYCRKCQESKEEDKFYDAKDKLLDSNGKMSVCISCVGEMFKKNMNAEMSIVKAIYNVCKIMNIAYKEEVAESTKKYIDKKMNTDIDYKVENGFAWYLAYLSRTISLHPELISTFEPTVSYIRVDSEKELENEDENFKTYLVTFWGAGLTWDEYQYLENELARWQRTHSCSTAAEETLLREICFVQLDLKKAREAGNQATDVLWKRLAEAMKLAAVDPAKQNALDSEKSVDSFGKIVKQIEETEPAEFFKDKEVFKDFDNIERYFEEYLVRPTKNFITGSRDFNTTEEGTVEIEEDVDGIELE